MKTIPIISVLLLVWCSLINGQAEDSIKFISLRPDDFQQAYNMETKAILIDVREFFEYRKSRLKNAVNIPSSGNLEIAAESLDKKCSLYLYCSSGFRSKRVAKFFYYKGFSKVYSLDGGIVAWKKQEMPVERNRIRRKNRLVSTSLSL